MSVRVSKALILIGQALALLGEEIGNEAPAIADVVKPPKAEPPKAEPKTEKAEKTAPAAVEPAPDLRAEVRQLIMSAGSKDKAAVLAALQTFGAAKQSEVKDADLPAFKAKLEAIIAG